MALSISTNQHFSVKSTFLLKKSPQCGKVLVNAITLKNFPWYQLFSYFFSKNVDLTEIIVIAFYSTFPQCVIGTSICQNCFHVKLSGGKIVKYSNCDILTKWYRNRFPFVQLLPIFRQRYIGLILLSFQCRTLSPALLLSLWTQLHSTSHLEDQNGATLFLFRFRPHYWWPHPPTCNGT